MNIFTHSWKNNRKDMVRGIISAILDRPFFIFFLFSGIFHSSWRGFVGAFVILIGAQFLIELFVQAKIFSVRLKTLRGFLYKHQKEGNSFELQIFSPSDYIRDNFKYQDISKYFVEMFGAIFPNHSFTLDNTIKIYHVKFQKNKLLGNATAFEVPMLGSNIFVDFLPEKATFFQKFIILHEIAHPLFVFEKLGKPRIKVYSVFVLMLLLFFPMGTITNFWIIVYTLLFFIGLLGAIYIKFATELHDEIVADGFAIIYLDEKDIDQLRKHSLLISSILDTSMIPKINKIRATYRDIAIKYASKGDLDGLLESSLGVLPKPSFLILLIQIGAIGFLGYLLPPITTGFLLGLLGISILLFIAYLLFFFIQSSLTSIVDSKLREFVIQDHTQNQHQSTQTTPDSSPES